MLFRMLIVDLDGTLVDCNSFTEFVKFLFRRYPQLRWRLASVVLKRKLRLISHHDAKERVVALAEKCVDEKALADFSEQLLHHVRQSLRDRIEKADRVILATAAPALYAVPFASMLGISEVCATEPGRGENKGERKLRDVERRGARFNSETVVITDHYDDLPLLKRNSAGKNILINPSAATLMHANMAGIRFDVEVEKS